MLSQEMLLAERLASDCGNAGSVLRLLCSFRGMRANISVWLLGVLVTAVPVLCEGAPATRPFSVVVIKGFPSPHTLLHPLLG